VIKDLDSQDSWYYDDSAKEWVNRVTGQRIADGQKEATDTKEKETGDKAEWKLTTDGEYWVN
jgi:hypothetical protein